MRVCRVVLASLLAAASVVISVRTPLAHAGALTGSGTAGPGPRRFCNGMLSLYMTPEAFGSQDAMVQETRAYLDFFKGARPVPGGEVLLPGEPERRTRAKRLADGVPLPDPVWETLLAAGRPFGLDGEAYRT